MGRALRSGLAALADQLSELLRRRPVLHADETPVQQLDPGKGKTKRAYLWAYRNNDLDEGPRIVVFDYQTGRSGAHARAFLADWTGHLVVDDYAGYKALFRAGITEVSCMAHARRKFFELHAANQNPVATEDLRRIAELHAIEACGRAPRRYRTAPAARTRSLAQSAGHARLAATDAARRG